MKYKNMQNVKVISFGDTGANNDHDHDYDNI